MAQPLAFQDEHAKISTERQRVVHSALRQHPGPPLLSLSTGESYTSASALVAQAVFQSPVDRHICNQSLICNDQLHILDIQHLGAQVASYLMDRDRAQSFYETIRKTEDSKGIRQSMVDLLQAVQLQFSHAIIMLIDVAY